MRSAGILMPIFSLPSKYGIGSFSKEAYDFVDFLADTKQKYWQILPLGPTGYGDSPYSSSSTFAGNYYFISLDDLIKKGLISNEDVKEVDFGSDEEKIDYYLLFKNRLKILKKAYDNSNCTKDTIFQKFCEDNKYWLDDYALYETIKSIYSIECTKWDKKFFNRDEKTLMEFQNSHMKNIEFIKYMQYLFYEQFFRLKKYANEKNVLIIGDLPIYVSLDSADFWSKPYLFMVDENNIPVKVAGCPPDKFAKEGQLWGNPLYNFDAHKKSGYSWWIDRMKHCAKLYDVIRIDHFRGFAEFYAIKNGAKNAIKGEWIKGPGLDLFKVLHKKIDNLHIIAEDLGFTTDSVIKLIKDTGYPGMKILQFAFYDETSDFLPHNYDKNCVVYTGTHDNQTVVGWYKNLETMDKNAKIFANKYMNRKDEVDNIHMDLIRLAFGSVANTCIIPMNDYLGLDDECRINTPSTLGNNWLWRMKKDAINNDLKERIKELTHIYGRCKMDDKKQKEELKIDKIAKIAK